MKKYVLISIMLNLALIAFGQTANSYMPLVSNGAHTATASGYQNWAKTALTYTQTIGGNTYKGYYDTISNKDTCKGLFQIGSNKASGAGLVKPNFVVDSIYITGSWKTGSIQMTLTKVSGTVVDTSWLQISDNGVNWESAGQDTVIWSNVAYTQEKIWDIPGRARKTNSAVSSTPSAGNAAYLLYNQPNAVIPYQFYRVVTSGTGATQAAIIEVNLVKKQGP